MNYSLQRNICRTCLTEGPSSKSIFSFEQIMGREIQLCDMLMTFSSLVVVHGDGLPENICLNCTQHMTAAYSFKKLCEASDATLREHFRDSNGIVILNSIKKEQIEFDDGVESMPLGQGERNESKDVRSGTQNVKTEINESEGKAPNFLHNIGINDRIVEPTINNFSLATCHTAVGTSCNNTCISQLEKSKHKETIDENGESIDVKPIFLDNDLDVSETFINKSEDKTHNFLYNNSGISSIIVEPKKNFSLASFHEPMEESCNNTLSQLDENTHKETIDENDESMDKKVICRESEIDITDSTINSVKDNSDLKIDLDKIEAKEVLRSNSNSLENKKSLTTKRNNKSNPLKKIVQVSTTDSHKKASKLLENLEQHTTACSGKIAFLCHLCGKSFATKYCLIIHISGHAGETPHKCKICGITYSTPWLFANHMRIHGVNNAFSCKMCDKSFGQVVALKEHIWTRHARERPYKRKAGNQSATLATHIKQKFQALKFSLPKK